MTSQEPPLTRREARERERLLQEQAASPTPENQSSDASAAPASAPSPFPPAQAAARPAANPFAPPAPVPPPTQAVPQPQQAAPVPARQTPGAPGPAAPAPAVPAPAAPASAVPSAPSALSRTPERTLTRRELRAMLDSHHLDEELDDEEIDDPVAPGAQPSTLPTAAAVPSSPSRPVAAPPSASSPPAAATSEAAEASTARRLPTAPPVAQSAPKATGHWTEQLDVEEVRAEPFDQLLSRGGVSRGVPTTTNALILPTLPDAGQIVSPQAAPGEVIVTGSIDLPRSYGATGVHPSQVDSSDIDRLFDSVEDAPTTGVAPVAATRAISTQAAAKQMMMAPPKKDGPNVPLVLAVTAGVLALGVVATLIIGAVFRLF